MPEVPPNVDRDPRLEYPVWLEPPDWRTGVTESLEWQTWVGVSETSAEQRVAQRRFPRRELEMRFRGFRFRQSLLQQSMVSAGRRRWLMPLWMNGSRLSQSVGEGETVLQGDFALRQFRGEDLVLLRSAEDFYRFEVVVPATATATQVTLQVGTQFAWDKDTLVFPLRVARLVNEGNMTLRTPDVVDVSLRFRQEGEERQAIDTSAMLRNPYDNGLVLGLAHNWRQLPTGQYTRQVFVRDNQQSRPSYFDNSGQSSLSVIYHVQTRGREELDRLRSLLYSLRGQQNEVWLPGLSADIRVVEQVIPAEGELVIERVGLAQYGAGGQGVRRNMVFQMSDGETIFAQMVSVRTVGNTERIVLADNLEKPYRPSDFLTARFLSKARLASDRIEVEHYTDTDGVQETALPFIMQSNVRQV